MSDTANNRFDFIDKVETLILENITNEQFGVSELAEQLNMSRSSLLRKIKTQTELSANQFIRQVRLAQGMELLKQDTLTISEISYQVGFGNTSYFIKCFRDHYGYSPGEVRKGKVPETKNKDQGSGFRHYRWYFVATVLASLIVVFAFFYNKKSKVKAEVDIEKSIAVLPFKNESSNSLNLYFVNGLMEATLNNLQKIGDLRVISRTSVTKYRSTTKGIPEIAEELQVNYLVEGSGQRIGNQVLLNIKLIEASSDKPIWVEQYNREVDDVFALQNEVAQKIARAIEVVVTPAELKQIEKIPTENLEAYDYYLQAFDHSNSRTEDGLKTAISLFEKAIEYDEQFALAYANVAFAYFFLDLYQTQKQYTESINNFADKALLHDPKSAESLMAKALYYMQIEEFKLALPHLEKALEYNPNSASVVNMLADIYARVIPNTDKYLEYALRGSQLEIATNDSVSQSFVYLHLSNALVQNGFVNEAYTYINKSLDYNPNNSYAPLLKAFILYARNGDIEQTKKLLIREWNKDTTRLDILQEVAKIYYFQEDVDSAFYYYQKFVGAREKFGLDYYVQEDLKIAWVYQKKGNVEQANKLFNSYAKYCEKDQSIYKSGSIAAKYAYEGKTEQAIEQLKIFATQDNYQYWIVLFQDKDPVMNTLKSHPEYDGIIQKIEEHFWEKHDKLKKLLDNKGLI